MSEGLKIAWVSGGCSVLSALLTISAVIISRMSSHGEHKQTQGTAEKTQQIVEEVHTIVSRNGQGKEKHP